MNPGLPPLCPEYAPSLLHCPLTQTHPPIPSWVLPAGGIDVWARAGPAGSSRGLCGIPEVASLAFVALWPLGVVLAILGGRGGNGSGSTEQPFAPAWGHTEPDGLREGGPLRLSGSASPLHCAEITPKLCKQGSIQLHPDEELITSHGSLSHRRFQMPAFY